MRSVKLIVLFVCRALGLFRLARAFSKRRLRILCYHGFELLDESAFRPQLFVKPDTFERRLHALARMGFDVLPFDTAVARLQDRSLPELPLAITVDDGFYSFYVAALPRLARHGYPATAFVTTYYVEHNHPIFRLVVQYMFWKTCERRLSLPASVAGTDMQVDTTSAGERAAATWACIRFGEQDCNEEGRQEICERLGSLLGVPYGPIVGSRALTLMSAAQLRSLAAANVNVELHTHRHLFPPEDPLAGRREVVENRAALARILSSGTQPRHFCYPSGTWARSQWGLLEEMNVQSAVTCMPGLNGASTPRLALRRFLDSEQVHLLQFEAALSGFPDIFLPLRSSTPDHVA